MKKYLILVFLFSTFVSKSFTLEIPSEYDHKILIKRLANSKNDGFRKSIINYDNYLKRYPSDISMHIEKCKFIDNV
jgi:hypothetical protein